MLIGKTIRFAATLAAAAALLTGHATWIAPLPPVLETGKSVTVHIANGHSFPASESAISPDDVELFVIGPEGARTNLTPSASGKTLSASHVIKNAGTYLFAFAQDRGVMSRTPTGLKPGGKDKNPDATRSMNLYRSAVAYSTTTGAKKQDAKAAGLDFELVPLRSADAVTVTLLWNGKPCAGAEIRSQWPGKAEQKAGTTGENGTFVYRVPAGARGQFLLTATLSEKAGPDATFDTLNYSTALYLVW